MPNPQFRFKVLDLATIMVVLFYLTTLYSVIFRIRKHLETTNLHKLLFLKDYNISINLNFFSDRVGKLSENSLKIGQDDTETNDDAESTANTGRVGKLTGERFKIGGEDGDENTDDCSDDMVTRVGKLSVDRLAIS